MARKPYTRLEHFLAAIAKDENAKELKPVSRQEHFLGLIAGNQYAKELTPINGKERYMVDIAALAAESVVPTGDKSITENGEKIDVAEYATVTVNVPAPSPEPAETT